MPGERDIRRLRIKKGERKGKGVTFSRSIAFRAFALSAFALSSISASSSSNLRFRPFFFCLSVAAVVLLVLVTLPFCRLFPSNPIIVFSNSLTLLSRSSSILPRASSSPSLRRRFSSASSRWISCFCARRLLTMHSRQNMSPWEAQATAARAGCRHRLQLAKGRKESRVKRVDCEPQVFLRRERSWVVKKAREVLRLPGDRGFSE